jgi:hypothetical protein
MNNQISVEPYSFGPRGEVTVFQINRFGGEINGFVTFFCQALTAGGEQLDAPVVNVTLEQFNTWVDDATFFALLAELAGYTPIAPE